MIKISSLTREDALKCFVEELNSRDILVGTTGMLSRELFEFRYLFVHLLKNLHLI